MTREEEIVRSTVAAIACTVTQVRPLRLTEPEGARPAGPVLPVTPVRLDGGQPPRRLRRWRSWGAPAAAAALIVAVTVTLVIIKNFPNGGEVTPAAPVPAPPPAISAAPALSTVPPRSGPVPRYFAELTPIGGPAHREGLLLGDTFTGQTVATVTPAAGTSFLSVSAAANDRSFAVFATPASAGPKVAGWWYLLRLAPGTSTPARLTRIPVPPLSDVAATALSGSGRELAVGRALDQKGTPWLGVYSVTTGRLLRSWSARSAPFRIEGFGVGLFPASRSNPQSAALTWVQNGRAITFLSVTPSGGHTLRRLAMATGGSDIVKDSQVIGSWPGEGCGNGAAFISADGKTYICVSDTVNTVGKTAHWTMRWLAYPVAPSSAPHLLFQASGTQRALAGLNTNTLWVSASGDVVLVEWSFSGNTGKLLEQHFGFVSHGTFTPLRTPPNDGDALESISPVTAW